MERPQQRSAVLGGLTAAVVLLLTAPGPTASLAVLADPAAAGSASAPLVALLALLAWCLSAYLLVVTALTAGAHLPGAAGHALAAVARRTAPVGLRRALELAVGTSLVVGTLGGPAGAAPLPPAPPASASTTAGATADHPVLPPLPSLDHPVQERSAVPTAGPVGRVTPAAAPASPARPTGPARPARIPAPTTALPHAPGHPLGPGPADAARPNADADADADAARPVTHADAVVVVQPGDSLWSLAEDRLGPQATDAQIAQTWPTWWQANREVVGDDPDLLLPGTPLTPPTDRP